MTLPITTEIWIASHLDFEFRITLFSYLLDSIKNQTCSPDIVYISYSIGVNANDAFITTQDKIEKMIASKQIANVVTLYQPIQLMQYEHIYQIYLSSKLLNDSNQTIVLMSDDDDLMHPCRVAIARHLFALFHYDAIISPYYHSPYISDDITTEYIKTWKDIPKNCTTVEFPEQGALILSKNCCIDSLHDMILRSGGSFHSCSDLCMRLYIQSRKQIIYKYPLYYLRHYLRPQTAWVDFQNRSFDVHIVDSKRNKKAQTISLF